MISQKFAVKNNIRTQILAEDRDDKDTLTKQIWLKKGTTGLDIFQCSCKIYSTKQAIKNKCITNKGSKSRYLMYGNHLKIASKWAQK